MPNAGPSETLANAFAGKVSDCLNSRRLPRLALDVKGIQVVAVRADICSMNPRTEQQALTEGRLAGLKCPADRAQVFVWDASVPGLAVRVARAGKRAFIFQRRFQRQTVRVTIGQVGEWSIAQARERARELQARLDAGHDLRQAKREIDLRTSAALKKAWATYWFWEFMTPTLRPSGLTVRQRISSALQS